MGLGVLSYGMVVIAFIETLSLACIFLGLVYLDRIVLGEIIVY